MQEEEAEIWPNKEPAANVALFLKRSFFYGGGTSKFTNHVKRPDSKTSKYIRNTRRTLKLQTANLIIFCNLRKYFDMILFYHSYDILYSL